MADIRITKAAAAQRQLDVAIRMLFAGEDVLAVHTLGFAAHTIVCNLDKGKGGFSDNAFAETLDEIRTKFPGAFEGHDVESFRYLIERDNRQGANFLKHADRDYGKALGTSALTTDHLLLQACSIYRGLGFTPTTEMEAFARWHLAVYPNEVGDRIRTPSGDVSDMCREDQLEVGQNLLGKFAS